MSIRHARILCATLASLVLSSPLIAAAPSFGAHTLAQSAWAMWRHDAQHTGRSAAKVVDSPIELWRASSWSASSPSIGADGTIYVGSTGAILAFTGEGKKKWDIKLPYERETVSSPAIAEDGTIYIGTGPSFQNEPGIFYAIAPDGSVKWSQSFAGGVASSPAIGADGTVYVGAVDGSMNAFERDGRRKWSFWAKSIVYSSPAITASGSIVFGTLEGRVYCLDPNGRERWMFERSGQAFASSPAIGTDGTIYIGAYDRLQNIAFLYALDPSGRLLWGYRTDGEISASPALASDGTIYVSTHWTNHFIALAPNGHPRWIRDDLGKMDGSPVIDGSGSIIVGSHVALYALNPDGTTKWSLPYNVHSSPSIDDDGTVYAQTLYGLVAVGACDAQTLCLGNGRFRIEVAWRDFEGNSGSGTAVPLTTDSGYFWFFNDANVELMIKVLDGRPVNGKYWVFYGALSNVEYTITVTDVKRKLVKTYTNPSGIFASTGDTDAFPGD